VKPGLRISDGPIQHFCDFRVLVALNVVEDNDQFLEWAELRHCALKIEAVERASQEQVGGGKLLAEDRAIAFPLFIFLKRRFE
jgi:hypothetical protein